MAPDAQLIAIDTNSDFIGYLGRRIADSRFRPVQGSAADVRQILADHGHAHADFILSGLPFSTLPPGSARGSRPRRMRRCAPGGAFLVYQFSPKVRDYLVPHFRRIDHDFEPFNVPPPQHYWAWKD
jgi:phospholipid N-methyltransferase